jgi:hypothetical protein
VELSNVDYGYLKEVKCVDGEMGIEIECQMKRFHPSGVMSVAV